MGFIRGGLLFFVSVLLFFILLLGNTFFVLSYSLKYENVQKELGPILKNFSEDALGIIEDDFNLTEKMDEARKFMEEHCQNETSYIFSGGGYTFVLPCDLLDEVKENSSLLVDKGIEDIIEQIYYDNYECKFWDCFKVTGMPLFFISEKAKNYWQDKFYLTLIISAVLVVLIFFLIENKQNTPLVAGSLLVLSSLPLLKLEKVVGSIAGDSYLAFIGVFFSRAGSVFWIVLIAGLILVLAGVALKFLYRGSAKKKFSKEDVQKIVKKEVKKNKRSNVKKTQKRKK